MVKLSLWSALTLWSWAALGIEHPKVTVLNGTYEGLYLPSFKQDIFLGIPYAQDTGGPNRFLVPQALNTKWNGTRPAKQYGPSCPDHRPDQDGEFGMGEDCLSINIVRPAGLKKGQKVPVLLWIHGGSYQVGTSALPYYNLTYLVQRSADISKPIIGASINYRKGGWGMLYSREIQGSGNANNAVRDMRKSLAWISENIGAFGGDKGSVTIWGNSAGSFAIGQLINSYGGRTDNLFHRTIQQSGSASTAWYNGSEWYQPKYDKIVSQTNCTEAIDTLACLRTIPYKTIYPFLDSSKVGGPGFYPTVDGDIIPNYPTIQLHTGRFAHIPHLYGTTSDEGTDNAPQGTINSTSDLYNHLLRNVGYDFPPSTINKILDLYPDDPSQGVPINTGSTRYPPQGLQYKRAAAIIGDVFYQAPRLEDARYFSKYAPTYIFRFNTRPWIPSPNPPTTPNNTIGDLAPPFKGVQHFSDVPFAFANPDFVGPWKEYRELSNQISTAWINFAYSGNPNGDGKGTGGEAGAKLPKWPKYSEGSKGLNLVLQVNGRGQNGSYVEEDTWRVEGREFLSKWARRRHV